MHNSGSHNLTLMCCAETYSEATTHETYTHSYLKFHFDKKNKHQTLFVLMEKAHWSEVTTNFIVLGEEKQQVSQYINTRFIRNKMLPALV